MWGALRRFFPEDVVAAVRGLSLTKDEKGAVFDVEDAFLPVFEKYIQEHGEGRPFAICTELPELPKAFEGFPIALVAAGLIALAFMGFSGLKVFG